MTPHDLRRHEATAALPPDRIAPSENRRAATATAVAVGVLALIVSVAALSEARLFAIPTLLAGLIAVALTPLARFVERCGAPSQLAAFLIVFGGVAGIACASYVVAPRYESFVAEAPDIARRFENMLRRIEAEVAEMSGETSEVGGAGGGDDDDEEGGLVDSGRQLVTDTLLATPALAGAAVYCVFLTYFLLAERSRVARAVLGVAQTQSTRRAMMRAMRDLRLQVSTYLFAITVVNILLGVATAVVFWWLGTPNALLWGAAMTLLNFMPYIGALVVNAGVFAVQYAATGQLEHALPPVVALALLNTIEGYGVTPRLIGRQVKVSALAVFFAIAFGAWLWGAAGALLATPALILGRAFAMRLATTPRAASRPRPVAPLRKSARTVDRRLV